MVRNYDRRFDDIFAIQDEIAFKVIEQLKVTLLGEAPQVGQAEHKDLNSPLTFGPEIFNACVVYAASRRSVRIFDLKCHMALDHSAKPD